MKYTEINSFLSSERKVNIILRAGAVIISIGCIILLTEILHSLLHDKVEIGFAPDNLITLCISMALFWPFSFVAIQGKIPKKWSPY